MHCIFLFGIERKLVIKLIMGKCLTTSPQIKHFINETPYQGAEKILL